ncbi:MAG: hypothetical protein IJY35_05675 [Clostridia bacterium]|nr:hypothetical protein [Clostridia bacterium]
MKKSVFALIFAGLLFLLGALHVILPDKTISHTERRALARFPAFDSAFTENLEKYLPDQFPAREGFRSVKSVFERLTGRLDTNGIYDVSGWLAPVSFGYDESSVIRTAERLTKLREMFAECPAAVICVIPPKTVYMHDGVHPVPDFGSLTETLMRHTDGYGFCGITGTLSLESYYKTDSHWRQEMLDETARMICSSLGVHYVTEEFTEHRMADFYGVYAGQSALPVEPDVLVYRSSPAIDNADVTAVGSEMTSVYTPEEIGVDMYDVFLGGAVPVIEIVNENGSGELVVIRDSFGSSLIPLLIPSFHRITAVDLRYISTAYLDRYADWDGADLLILLSADVIANSEMLRIE